MVGRDGKGTSRVCTFCKKKGHLQRNCWINPENPRNRLAGKGSSDDRAAPASSQADDKNCRSEKQQKGSKKSKGGASRLLLARLNSATSTEMPKVLLDSGASYHMCPEKSWFRNMKQIESKTILTGDESKVIARYRGDVALSAASFNTT